MWIKILKCPISNFLSTIFLTMFFYFTTSSKIIVKKLFNKTKQHFQQMKSLDIRVVLEAELFLNNVGNWSADKLSIKKITVNWNCALGRKSKGWMETSSDLLIHEFHFYFFRCVQTGWIIVPDESWELATVFQENVNSKVLIHQRNF